MALPTTFTAQTQSRDNIQLGKKTLLGFFLPQQYSPAAKTWTKGTGVFCVVDSADGLAITPINETVISGIGKKQITITEGFSWEKTYSIKGNAMGIFRVFGNTDPLSLSTAIQYHYEDMPVILFEHVYGADSNTIAKSIIYPNATMKVTELAGNDPNGETMYSVTFYNNDATDEPPLTAKPSHLWVHESWYEGGSVVNAVAPDAVITTFTLGTGNDSYVGVVGTPVAVIYDNTKTAVYKYLRIWVNGVEQTSGITFNAVTSVITFAVAPALNAKLSVLYQISQATSAPTYDGGASPTAVGQTMYGWNDAGNA